MILHIDMDAFFASVEQLDNPEYRNRPLVVGGRSGRSVVSAASYEARRFGIHSAMPVFMAVEKCPDVIVATPRRKRYKEISSKVMSILSSFSPLVEPVSIDEAYVDVTGCGRLFGSPLQIAGRIRQEVRQQTGLTCSVGVAPNKFLAKIASDRNKPDGLYVIEKEAVISFIENLPVGRVPGVGKQAQRELALMGVKTLSDIRRFPETILTNKLGKFGIRLMELSRGIDNRPVAPISPCKSISTETTLEKDIADKEILSRYLLMQAEEVARGLRRAGMKARTVVLKVKHSDFRQSTRSVTLENPVESSEKIYTEARNLLGAYSTVTPLRLIGVGVSNLTKGSGPVQPGLFEKRLTDDEDWKTLDRTLDGIYEICGKWAVSRASLNAFAKKDKKE